MRRSRSVRLFLAALTTTVVTAGMSAGTAAGSAAASPASHARLAHNIQGSVAFTGKSTLARKLSRNALPAGVPHRGSYGFLVRLRTPSTSTAYRSARVHGVRAARVAARAQLHAIDIAQSRLISRLPAHTAVTYRIHALMSGVAVYTNVHNYAALRGLSGVTAVYPIGLKYASNAYAVPLQGAPQTWQSYGDTGAGTSIAVIDTGVDYTHANFGGPGTVAAYKAAKANDSHRATPGSYDPAKFDATTKNAKGQPAYFYDFAGDAYNPARAKTATPHPDPNPLDCNSHGSHVAGSAAGYGENANGTTYDGSYNTSTPFSTMRIGPGMAPEARIWAYKVFGCHGGTGVVGAALDRAMDPNGDGSTADHADVVNMSLGLDFGSPQDGDSILSGLASRAGITVVAAAGNAGDIYDIGGSPGNVPQVIAAASSVDAFTITDSVTVSAPPSIAGKYSALRSLDYAWKKNPDLSGQVVALSDPNNQDGCDPFNATDKARANGKIVFEEWTSNDFTRRCGSVDRATNLENAHASGFVFGQDIEAFPGAFGISGSTKIPGVLVAKSGADAIRSQLAANNTVTISGTGANNFKHIVTGLDDTVSSFTSRDNADAGDLKPDISAVGDTVFSTGMGTGNRGLTDSGTSMATPMTSGAAALVLAKHPGWRPGLVKADLMNTADHDLYTGNNHSGTKYAPNRVGAGRLDVKNALDNHVLAYTVDGPHHTSRGVVSASFGPLAVRKGSGTHTYRKLIRVQNTGGTAQSYDVSYSRRTGMPGATYSVRPATLTVAPHSAKTVTLTLTVNPAALTKTIDPTVSRIDDATGFPRQYLADASGLVLFTSTTGAPTLRVPAYAAPRPASTMTQAHTVKLSRGAVQRALIALKGRRVDQGSGDTTIESIVAGFELQAVSGLAPHCSKKVTRRCVNFPDERSSDLKYVGSTSSATQVRRIGGDPLRRGLVYFSITTQGPWRTAIGLNDFRIFIDGNGDGRADAELDALRLPGLFPGDVTDVPVAALFSLKDGSLLDLEPLNDVLGDVDTAMFNSNTIILPTAIGAIPGVTRRHSRIHYIVQARSGYQNAPVDTVGTFDPATRKLHNALTMDTLRPGVAVFGSYNGHGSALLYDDSSGSVLEMRRYRDSYRRDHALGALMIHLHNPLGSKAQRVALTN